MHRPHAGALELRFDAEIELRRVDADEELHARGDELAHELAPQRKNPGQPRQDLDEPATDNFSSGNHGSQPAACILGPATPTNRACGSRSRTARISVAASASPDGFAGDDADGHATGLLSRIRQRVPRIGAHRMMPRPGSARNSTSGAITGEALAASASAARASSSERPSR